ncbi:low specificity L-threonine aldolase [Candidatus Micrarchaeota archaeon]|nr:low specificity L-threonine aldolase [Candidatus Micrarchaeota archaeon]
MHRMINFASDNWAPAHPNVLKAVQDANEGPEPAYGNDEWTKKAEEKFKKVFGKQAETFFVFTGTGANVLSLQALTRPHHAVLCAKTAHAYEDECGAPERFTGSKLLPLETSHGKLDAETLENHLGHMAPHQNKPTTVSITQSTELGTTYTLEEMADLTECGQRNKLGLHVDGARLCNAAAYLNVPLKQLVEGVDVLSFGGTKNGLLGAEAVVFLNPEKAEEFAYTRKQSMQLASKMRYLSAQFLAFFENDLWLENARHANEMAKRLEEKIREAGALTVLHPVEANLLFVKLPQRAIDVLQKDYAFYELDPINHVSRFVTSFNTKKEEVDAFAEAIQKAVR